jgi:hypothetical protein
MNISIILFLFMIEINSNIYHTYMRSFFSLSISFFTPHRIILCSMKIFMDFHRIIIYRWQFMISFHLLRIRRLTISLRIDRHMWLDIFFFTGWFHFSLCVLLFLELFQFCFLFSFSFFFFCFLFLFSFWSMSR